MNRIAEALYNSGLTQIELSNKTGIGKGLISRYVSGKVSPKSNKANLSELEGQAYHEGLHQRKQEDERKGIQRG